jgi:hypothetical protein
MVLDLATNEDQPLLGTVGAIVGLHEVGLQTEDLIVDFASHEINRLFSLSLRSGNASFTLNLDPFDPRIGFSFDLIDPPRCSR